MWRFAAGFGRLQQSRAFGEQFVAVDMRPASTLPGATQ